MQRRSIKFFHAMKRFNHCLHTVSTEKVFARDLARYTTTQCLTVGYVARTNSYGRSSVLRLASHELAWPPSDPGTAAPERAI